MGDVKTPTRFPEHRGGRTRTDDGALPGFSIDLCAGVRGEQGLTRLAPSPTGALHLGNARTFLINWAMARQRGWKIVLRIEDLDGPRVKAGADRQAVDDLRWLGLDWDHADEATLYQNADLSPYQAALARLHRGGLAYPCWCTRSQIQSAQSAPHAGQREPRYPGTCRPQPGTGPQFRQQSPADTADAPAWRLIVPDAPVEFDDQVRGRQAVNVQQTIGDFVIATKAGLPAYQLAVVVDDARQGVSDVVRGDDLLASTARQLLLYRMLELAPPRRWWHVPLVVGPDGRRLAKRHGDSRIASYRQRGVPAERIIGLTARWCGLTSVNRPMPAEEFCDRFRLGCLPDMPVALTAEDHRWLLKK